MTDKPFLNDNVAINFPLESSDQAALKLDESLPPSYEYPRIDFSSGWKDRGFAIVFWIHLIAVIIVGSVLGIPIVLPYVKHNIFNREDGTSLDPNFKLFVYAFGGAAATGGFMSLIAFFLLQRCPGRIIQCSLFIMVIIEILVCGFLAYMASWFACVMTFICLLGTLYYISYVQKRIAFAEIHLRVSCAVVRSHPSTILVALIMLVVEFLWLVFWCLMVLGILHVTNLPILNRKINLATTFTIGTTKPTLINNTPYMITSTTYRINEESYRYNAIRNSSAESQDWYTRVVAKIVLFFLLLSWYWGATTFSNVVHFITACTVGQWWFTADAGEQYVMRTSFKRAFTTNFGTICFGSLLQAIVKAVRSCAKSKKRSNILTWCADCILALLEKLIGYINEWAFVYAALTGQSFIAASRSFIALFKKRGWTMVINDSIVDNCLTIVNVVAGLVSAAVGGLIVYLLVWNSSKETISTIIVIAIISFLIGVFLSATMTTILSSCVRTAVVCFALNPAALGATHPDHLQSLTRAWHKFYPEEFAASGYANYSPNPAPESYV